MYSSSSTGFPLQLPNIQSSKYRKFYKCKSHDYMSDVCGDPCPLCKNAMFFDLSLVLPSNVGVEGATYIVTDDLEVKPLSKFSMMTLLNQIGVNEVGAIEEKRKAVDLGNICGMSVILCFLHAHDLYLFLFFTLF